MKHVTIIGGGPAALLLAAGLDRTRFRVSLYERKKTLGRKFLVAGEGGLNLTYDEPLADLINHYAPADFMAPALRQFTNIDLRNWLRERGVPTFTGSSKRVFPDPGFKPIDVLNILREAATNGGADLHLGTEWRGWNVAGDLLFEGAEPFTPDLIVFALGGASWRVTGSDGSWASAFGQRGLRVNPFRAANCAFGVDWSADFVTAHAGKPLKNIALSFGEQSVRGELTITDFGLEGNAIYALSHRLQEALGEGGPAVIYLDLKPTLTPQQVRAKLGRSAGKAVSALLKSDLNLNRTEIALLKQGTDKATFLNPDRLAQTIKALPLRLHSAGPLDEAISTLGGLALSEVDENFRCRKLPNAYAIGEMLDWFAPTGGYLLQGCFSMGMLLARHLNGLER